MATTAETLLQEYAEGKREFQSSYLAKADLSQKTLQGSDLGFSYLSGANLFATNLVAVNLGFAFLGYAYLGYSYLSYSNFSYAYLCNADLSNADLSNANFSNADLTNVKFNGAKLTGAKFDGAKLTGADFKDAKLDGVIFPETPAPALASGQFSVPAIQITGVNFTNPVNAEITVVFTPSGWWSLAGTGREWACTSAGYIHPSLDGHKRNSLYPNCNLGSLVAVSQLSNAVTVIDNVKRIRMKPNESLTFLMNDDKACYRDNQGSVTVSWAAVVTS
ncbi:MAG: pentapeptide repeat-containing protein [Oscillatoria sp. Prado101]|jgi:uncharacterized protein YjbI with pentapeptide repeats|nr:pentapeptide repeat-containing protein [Oscillatoria sp. Prado101]